jgi:hypothetical protein
MRQTSLGNTPRRDAAFPPVGPSNQAGRPGTGV